MTPISEAMPENLKLVLCRAVMLNVMYKEKIGYFVGFYCSYRTREVDCDFDYDCDYDEETDTEYWPEGWYEQVLNWTEYSCFDCAECTVTHWGLRGTLGLVFFDIFMGLIANRPPPR